VSASGLDTNTSRSDYIQLNVGDEATPGKSLASIKQSASMILQAIEPGEIAAANGCPKNLFSVT